MNNAERFIEHLHRLTGRPERTVRRVDSSRPGLRPVFVFVYDNWPEDGFSTGFTFGLSDADHPDWKLGKPEVMISVASHDESWAFAAACVAERLRGRCPFCYGDTIRFGSAISEESELDAFLVFAPPFLEKSQSCVELGDFTCNIVGLYPIFSSEIALYEEIGLKEFWHLPGWDPFDVHRRPERAKPVA
jgi:hypothetical protein